MTQDPAVDADTADLREACFRDADLRGATLRECDLRGVRVIGSIVDGLEIWSFAGELGSVRFEGIEVTGFVQTELDRRHPERVLVREMTSADDYRTTWSTLRGLWADLEARADLLPEAVLHQRVDDEWSLVETMRHLVFATDLWLGRMVNEDVDAFHPLGLPPGDSTDEAALVGLTPTATPRWSEVAALHQERMRQMSVALAEVGDADLTVERTRVPFPAWGEETHSVGSCLRIVAREHSEHLRYALRDLGALAVGHPPGSVRTS